MAVNALNLISPVILREIVTDVTLKNPMTGQSLKTKGIWDTGATDSVITANTARQLGLMPISKAFVRGVHGPKEVNVYYVNITLNNDQITLNARVTECVELSADNSKGMLIGMNIISMGDFAVSNYGGSTVMSFRRPSLEHIDFVNEIREFNRLLAQYNAQRRHGNEKCPCGSGKLWKNCHGKSKYNQ